MAILTRPRLLPQERFDLEDLNALLAALRTDSKLNVNQFLSQDNLIYSGFVVTGIGSKSATVNMSGATLIIPQNTNDFSWFTSSVGEPNITISDAEITDNTRNYVEIKLLTENNTPLTKAFWDPEAASGQGSEFNQIIDTMTDLKVEMVVSTGGFSGSNDRIPLCIIDTDSSGNIKQIFDRRRLFGRLGKPTDIFNQFSWSSKIEPVYTVALTSVSGTFVAGETLTIGTETATVVSGGTSSITFNKPSGTNFFSGNSASGGTSGASGTVNTVSESFTGADKDLKGQKNINDALMTEIASIKGTDFWFENTPYSVSGLTHAVNSIIAPFSSSAKYFWTGSNLKLTDNNGSPSSADVIGKLRLFGSSSQLNLSRMDGTGGSSVIPIADGEVLYVELPTSGNRTYSGVGAGSTNYKVASRLSFSLVDKNYWIAYREGTKLLVRFQGDLSAGEVEPIGDTVPQTLLDNLGLTDTETAPSYSSNIRGTTSENLVSRIGKLTDAIGDEQEDRSGYLRSNDEVTWSSGSLSFTSNIVLEFLNTKSGTLTQHNVLTANSPISLNNGESVYVVVNRASASENLTLINSGITPIPAQTQANKDVIVLFRRIDATGVKYLYIPFMKQMISEGQTIRLGQAGSAAASSGTVKADFLDPLSTTLPSGASVTIDGVSGADGNLVLFSNLTSGNNKIYMLGGVGTSITWTAQSSFSGVQSPTDGDEVRIRQGVSFQEQLAVFDGTNWKVNDVVRLFNGVSANFWELGSIKAASIVNNTTGTVFSVNYLGSENMIIPYSILRGSVKETGQLFLTTDGSTVSVTKSTAYIGSSGVEFSASISVGVMTLSYTSDNSGSAGTLKYFVQRWSDATTGGPTGIPSYSGVGGGGAAGGANKDVQFNNGGALDGDSRLQWDATLGALDFNGMKYGVLSSGITLLDNQASPVLAVAYDKTYNFVIIEYSISRGGESRVGRLILPNNGTSVSINDDFVDTASVGIVFSASIVGSNVNINYTSTSTGSNGTFKYTIRRWN